MGFIFASKCSGLWVIVVAQQMSTTKLQVLSKSLKRSMVTKGLALMHSHNIKQFTNL